MPKDIGNESMLDESGEKECLVCFGSEMPIDVVLLPCQHSGMCVDCALLVLRTTPPECPVCRTAVEEILRFVGEDPTTPGGYDDTDQAAAHGPDGGAGVLPPSSHGQDDVRDASAEAASATVRSEPQEPDRWPPFPDTRYGPLDPPGSRIARRSDPLSGSTMRSLARGLFAWLGFRLRRV